MWQRPSSPRKPPQSASSTPQDDWRDLLLFEQGGLPLEAEQEFHPTLRILPVRPESRRQHPNPALQSFKGTGSKARRTEYPVDREN